MNPCVQRSLVFGARPATPAPGTPRAAPPRAEPAWHRGEVNRAAEAHVTVGGKGQHVAIALARAAAAAAQAAGDALPPRQPLQVRLVQFTGGPSGAMARGFLVDAFDGAAAAPTPSGTAGGAAGPQPPAELPPSASAVLLQRTVELRAREQPTRTCTTVLDASAGDMTELIEPPAPVDAEQAAQLLQLALAALGGGGDGGGGGWRGRGGAGGAPTGAGGDGGAGDAGGGDGGGRVVGLALMGTYPPGAEGVYEALSAHAAAAGTRQPVPACAAAAAGAPPSPPHDGDVGAPPPLVVLLDAVKGAWPCLLAGGVTLLKLNAGELRSLVADGLALARREPQRFGAVGEALGAVAAAEGGTRSSSSGGGGGGGGGGESEGEAAAAAAAGDAPAADAIRQRAMMIRAHAAGVLRATVGTALEAVAVTDGPHAAHLLQRRRRRGDSGGGGSGGGGSCGGDGGASDGASDGIMTHTVFTLPPLPGGRSAVNPIGAGDSVAAATLHAAAVAREPLATAFARGLAAGCASVLSVRGAQWDAGDAAAVARGIRAEAEDVGGCCG